MTKNEKVLGSEQNLWKVTCFACIFARGCFIISQYRVLQEKHASGDVLIYGCTSTEAQRLPHTLSRIEIEETGATRV